MNNSFFLILCSWLFPGFGFIVKGRYIRGFTLFFIISLTFFIGILMHGEVTMPNTSPRDWGYNIMSILSFIISLGNGFLSLFSILSIHFKWGIIKGLSYHPLYELAAFFIVVSKKHIKCLSYKQVKEEKKKIVEGENKYYLGDVKEFETNKEVIKQFCKYAIKFFKNV